MKSVVIKLSSALIMHEDAKEWLNELPSYVKKLQIEGYQVCLVTSGATALGKRQHGAANETNQFYAIIGQPLLYELYSSAFAKKDIETAQLLINKDDFKNRDNYLEVRDAVHELLKNNIVPLINENDATHSKEYTFSDNDEIGGLLASLLGSERLVLASSVEGLIDDQGNVIPSIEYNDKTWQEHIKGGKSEHGRGGMQLKCEAADLLSRHGISTTICSGLELPTLYKAAMGQNVGTIFQPNKQLPAKKRWLLDHAQFADASVSVDERAANVMRNSDATSLLTVGITAIDGNFSIGDVITIIDPKQQIIGYGQAQYPSEEAKNLVGKQSAKPLVHYDHYVGAL